MRLRAEKNHNGREREDCQRNQPQDQAQHFSADHAVVRLAVVVPGWQIQLVSRTNSPRHFDLATVAAWIHAPGCAKPRKTRELRARRGRHQRLNRLNGRSFSDRGLCWAHEMRHTLSSVKLLTQSDVIMGLGMLGHVRQAESPWGESVLLFPSHARNLRSIVL